MDKPFDLAIIGGGINGCGIAALASLQGLSVVLCEKDDLASKTSSSSTKLIHGGLRYLEYYHFGLVKKALKERQTLLNLAPHLVHPLRFMLPYHQKMRPSWLLRAGLFLYDHLTPINRLPTSRYITRKNSPHLFDALHSKFAKGFSFYDCATDDARLTIANAIQAKELGATILTNHALCSATNQDNRWKLTLKSAHTSDLEIEARCVINATGPWVNEVNQFFTANHSIPLHWIKGSHVIVHQLYPGDMAYLLQHEDNRIIFTIPYHGHTLIGTTEITLNTLETSLHIDNAEINYLFAIVQSYFNKSLKHSDIIHTYSGVRPIIDNTSKHPSALSRDYMFKLQADKSPPLLSIYGGKITTYRQLATQVMTKLAPFFPHIQTPSVWPKLPGSQHPQCHQFEDYIHFAKEKYFWLEQTTLKRYLETYGTLTERILSDCYKHEDLGFHFGHGLFQKEVDYLVEEEWACNAEDVLWRRTKLGLHLEATAQQSLEAYIQSRPGLGS